MTVLKACVSLSLVAVGIGAGTHMGTAQAIRSGGPALAPTRIEVYGGYAYFHPLGGTIAKRTYSAIQPGGVGSATYFFGRYLGAQAEVGGFPQGPNDSVATGQAGPVLRYPYGRFSPFVHALGGAARVRGPASQPPTWGWGLTGGVGLDYVVPGFNHQLAIRPIQADFEFSHVDYGKLAVPGGATGGLGEIKAYRLSAGVVLRFGGDLPRERPLIYTCEASPSTIFAGDPVTVTGNSVGPVVRSRSIYTWAISGGHIDAGDGNGTANIATAGLAPGDYTVSGHLSQGKRSEQNAACTASFTVQAPLPPTISCSASPVSVQPGGRATVSSIANSPQGRPLRFSYSATAGKIASTIAIATLDTANAPPGSVTVSCMVTDDQWQTANATTAVNVSSPPAPMAEQRTLCTLNFARDTKRPVRVDNEAKACLDDVALTLNREVSARLSITGESSADEKAGQASARASNARLYLTQEKGIDPSRIDVKTGTSAGRTAEIELIPVGTPIRYSDAPAPSEPKNIGEPAATVVKQPPSSPVYEGPGTAVPRRSTDSLVLPPLPTDALAGHGIRHLKPTAKRRRRHKVKAAGQGSAPKPSSGAAKPTP